MSKERLNSTQADSYRSLKLQDAVTSEVLNSDGFDLSTFFGLESEEETSHAVDQPLPDLLLTLRNDSNESIATITAKVTAEKFAAGASLTSSIFSALGSIVGSCGVFCVHSLGAVAQAGSSLSGATGIGGLNMPGFSVDRHGNFHLDGNIDSLSRATGISKSDLLSGRFSAEDVLTRFFTVFGGNIGLVFGFGLAEMLIGCMFDCILPTTSRADKN
jgi:hypothetical protein